MYAAASMTEARLCLERFYRHCRESEIRELERLAKTVRRWEAPILAWHTTGLTNGPTEAITIRSISMAVADVGDGALAAWSWTRSLERVAGIADVAGGVS